MNRKVLLALMGAQPGPVFNSTQLLTWTDLYIFYSDKYIELASSTKTDLKRIYRGAGIKIVEMNPFDMNDGISTIIREATKTISRNNELNLNTELSISITGGTDVMTSAALLAGIMLKADLYYIKSKRDEETGEYHNPQLIQIYPPQLFFDELDQQKYNIMQYVQKSSQAGNHPNLAELAAKAGFNSSAALKRHLDTLEQKGIIESKREGKSRIITLTQNGEMFLLMKKAFDPQFKLLSDSEN